MTDGDVLPERMGPVPRGEWDARQQQAAEAFTSLRGVAPFGPFERLIRSPELLTHVQSLGEFLRYRASLEQRLVELAILVTAREWDQEYEWSLHAPLALQAGLPRAVIDAVNESRRPVMEPDEAACFDVSIALHRQRRLDDAAYAQATVLFGEHGILELTAVNGYYALLAMQMNLMRTPPVESGFRLVPRAPRPASR